LQHELQIDQRLAVRHGDGIGRQRVCVAPGNCFADLLTEWNNKEKSKAKKCGDRKLSLSHSPFFLIFFPLFQYDANLIQDFKGFVQLGVLGSGVFSECGLLMLLADLRPLNFFAVVQNAPLGLHNLSVNLVEC
jgi:hypothetical protein